MERASLTHEIMDLLKRKVKVTMKDGEEYVGNLIGISLETFTLCLGDVETSNGKKYYRILLNGEEVRSLAVEEAMIDLRKLAERLERVFPTMVKYNEEARVIVVMDRIRVGEKGIIEGSGPAAEKVEMIYREFIKEMEKEKA